MNCSTDKKVKIDFRKRRGKSRGRQVHPLAMQEVRGLLGELPRRRDLLIEALHLVQDHFKHLPARHLVALADEFKLAPTEVFEVATFYHHFDVVKEAEVAPSELTVRVCDSMSCRIAGVEKVIGELEGHLSGEVRIQRVPCVGRCQHAPVAVVGQNPVDQATLSKISETVRNRSVRASIPEYVNYQAYLDSGGYAVYQSCVSGERTPEEVIRVLEDSKLRGLGGAGFPAGSGGSLGR